MVDPKNDLHYAALTNVMLWIAVACAFGATYLPAYRWCFGGAAFMAALVSMYAYVERHFG